LAAEISDRGRNVLVNREPPKVARLDMMAAQADEK